MNERIILANEGTNNSDLTAIYGVAYSGGEIRQEWCPVPIVVDLTGFTAAKQIPLLYNHYNDPDMRLGEVKAEVIDGAVYIKGGIDASTERGQKIIDAGKRVKWQLSIGAQINASKGLEPNESAVINGRQVRGPMNIATSCELREVSVVAVGADAETELTIAASWGKVTAVNNEPEHITKTNSNKEAQQMAEDLKKEEETAQVPEEPVAAATPEEEGKEEKGLAEEIAEIKRLLNDLKKVEPAKEEPAEPVQARRGTSNILIKRGHMTDSSSLEAALEFRCGISGDSIAASLGHEAAEAGARMSSMSLKDVTREALKLSGHFTHDYLDRQDIIAGFQTTDLPQILSNVAQKSMLKSFQAQDVAATKLCSAGDLADYKEAIRVRLSDVGELKVVPAGSEVPQTQLGEDYAKNKADRYASVFWLDETLIINDDLGAFLKIPEIFGTKAAAKIDEVFFSRLTANPTFTDSVALFHANHKNLTTGSSSVLSLASLKKAYTLFRKQTDRGGMPINVVPKYVVVPAELEPEAYELTSSQTISGGTTAAPTYNVISKWGLEVVASSWLDANSTTAWYLFADPAKFDTFEIGYLRGQRSPIVERGNFDLNRFGIGYRVRFDFGIREMDFRGISKNVGA